MDIEDIEMPDCDDRAEEVQPLGTPGRIIQDLCSMDLGNVTSRSVDAICDQLSTYQDNAGDCIPLGTYQGVEYYLSLGPLLGGSFNHIDYREEDTVPEIMKRLKCYSSRADTYHTCLAIAIGRLGVKFQPEQPILYSRWVVLMDRQNKAMAMFANSVDQREHTPEGFTYDFVPIFGADVSLGELIIEFGPLATCFPYAEGQQMKYPTILKRASWITHFAEFAQNGHLYPARTFRLTVSPDVIDGLRTAADISYLTIPKYRGRIRFSSTNIQKLDIVGLRDFIGFQAFLNDLRIENKEVVVGRKVAETAWCAAILKTFIFQNEYLRELAHTYQFDKSVEAVSDCLLQAGFSPEFSPTIYWEMIRFRHPGLDISTAIEIKPHPKADNFEDLKQYLHDLLNQELNNVPDLEEHQNDIAKGRGRVGGV